MTSKRKCQEKAEAYARALIEAARLEDRANVDLVQWNHAVKFSPEVLETLAVMHEHGDMNLIGEVDQIYKDMLDTEDPTVSVTVTTAVPMDDELRNKVRSWAEDHLKSPVYLVERVDPEILGGVIVEARGKRHDASVRAQLSGIRKSLSSVRDGSEG